MDMLGLIIQYTLVFASVLALVALGGMFAERSGVINLGLEGTMVIGALGGALTMRYLPDTTPGAIVVILVILVSVISGILYSTLLSLACITFKADQTITGTALNIMAPALATVVVKAITLNQDGKATPKLDYIKLQQNFVFKLTEVNFSWVVPVALLLISATLILVAIRKTEYEAKSRKIQFILGIVLAIVGIILAVLFATNVLDAVTFNWAIFIVMVFITIIMFLNTVIVSIVRDEKIIVKNVVRTCIMFVASIVVLVLNLINFFDTITMNWFMPLMFALVGVSYYVIYHTKFGLRLMACGENPQAADSVGINVIKMRYIGVLISGVLAGIGGIAFIASVNSSWSFDYGVSGFGFLALAVMIFGQWKPLLILAGAILFGFFRAIGLTYTAIPVLNTLNIDSTWYTMLPYVVCLVVLAFTSKKSRAPKAEGIPYDKSQR